MAAATATHHLLHDPFSPHHTHYAPADTAAVLDLLATDRLVDARAPPSAVTDLLNDLLAVDVEVAAADARRRALKDEQDLLLDLFRTDQQVDGAKHGTSAGATGGALHDPYRQEAHAAVEHSAGLYAAAELRENVVLLQLLAMDESVDDGKRYQQLVQSDAGALIGELYGVDREVGTARRRATLVADLQGLLDVDHLVDGVPRAEKGEQAKHGGQRSIFSAQEKHWAKASNKYAH